MDRVYIRIENGVIMGVTTISNFPEGKDPEFTAEENMVEVSNTFDTSTVGWDYNNGNPIKGVFHYTVIAEQELEDRLAAVNILASNTIDWSEISDEKKSEWIAYRNALKGVKSQTGFPTAITWPTKPE